jgi:hypothetical protein
MIADANEFQPETKREEFPMAKSFKKNETMVAPIQAPAGPREIKASEILADINKQAETARNAFEVSRADMIADLSGDGDHAYTIRWKAADHVRKQVVAAELAMLVKFLRDGHGVPTFRGRIEEVIRHGEKKRDELVEHSIDVAAGGSTCPLTNVMDNVKAAARAKLFASGWSGINPTFAKYLDPQQYTLIDDVCVNSEAIVA